MTIIREPAPDTRSFDQGFAGEVKTGDAIQWWIPRHCITRPCPAHWSEWADVLATDDEAAKHPTCCDVPPSRDHRCLLLRFEDGSERAMWFTDDILRIARRVDACAWYQANLPDDDARWAQYELEAGGY